ncbi:hypothetical protein DFH07DRAFT_766059 [Mycena maculata]|uniref:Uncharacterized protein n=1 Tax=Mycena maculata TaxID=230809 RepID=A0AAD7K3V4_9AGAR|nr:hypothetical protein DFH07DRAFT_766059 [Mycena maculata]
MSSLTPATPSVASPVLDVAGLLPTVLPLVPGVPVPGAPFDVPGYLSPLSVSLSRSLYGVEIPPGCPPTLGASKTSQTPWVQGRHEVLSHGRCPRRLGNDPQGHLKWQHPLIRLPQCGGGQETGVPGLAALTDSVVLSSVRAATRGRLHIAMSGSAATSRETQEFLSVTLVILLQGACDRAARVLPLRHGGNGIEIKRARGLLLQPRVGERDGGARGGLYLWPVRHLGLLQEAGPEQRPNDLCRRWLAAHTGCGAMECGRYFELSAGDAALAVVQTSLADARRRTTSSASARAARSASRILRIISMPANSLAVATLLRRCHLHGPHPRHLHLAPPPFTPCGYAVRCKPGLTVGL